MLTGVIGISAANNITPSDLEKTLQTVERTFDVLNRNISYVGITKRGPDIIMTQKILDITDIRPLL